MVRLHFKSTEEFEVLFRQRSLEVTDAIVDGIENAMAQNKKTALLFEVSIDSYEIAYEISLPSSQWEESLQLCLDHYHELNLTDQQIDTWKLLETVKVW